MDLNVLDTQPSQMITNNVILNSEPSDEYNDLEIKNQQNKQTPHQTYSDEEEEDDDDNNVLPLSKLVDTDRDHEELRFIPISPKKIPNRCVSSTNHPLQHPTLTQTRGIFANLMQQFLLKTFVRKLSNKRNMNSQFNQYHFNVINDKGSVLNMKLFTDNALCLKPILQPQNIQHNKFISYILMKRILISVMEVFIKINHFIERIPIFYPQSMSKLIWNCFVQIARVYFLFVIPLDLSILQVQFMFGVLYSITVVMLSLLIVDFLVSLNTSHYVEGQIVINRLQIIKHVIWKSGGLELASVIILVLFWFIVEIDNSYKVDAYGQTYQLGLMIFYIQCRNISKFIRQVEDALNLSKHTRAILELLKLISAVIVVLHVFACLWYWAGYYSQVQYGKSWLDIRGLVDLGWQNDYLYAFYYSTVTMFTVGYGDITPQSNLEIVISICYMMITSIQLSYSVSTVGAIIDKISVYEEEKFKKLQTINNFMQSKKIGYELQYQIREYLNYYWQAQNEEDTQQEKTIISQLSEKLRLRLMLEANSLILNNCILFRNHFSAQLKIQLVKCIRQVVVQPEDIIDFDNLQPEKEKNQIYLCFIEKGSIQILIENEENSMTHTNYSDVSIVSQLNEGQSLGLISFITGNKSPERYRSIGFTKLLLLNRDDFLRIITDFPEDNEQYHYFQDQLKFYQRSDFLKMQCFSCNSPDHKAINCPLLHFIPDREFLIKQDQFSRHQMRNEPNDQVYKRKCKKATMGARQDQDYIEQSAVFFQNDYWQETLFFDCEYGEVSQFSIDDQKQDSKPDDEVKEIMKIKSSFAQRQQTRSFQATNTDEEFINLQNHSSDYLIKQSMKKTNKSVKFKLMPLVAQFNTLFEEDDSVQNSPVYNLNLKAKRAHTIEVPQMGPSPARSIIPKEKNFTLRQKFQKVVRIVKSINSISKRKSIQKIRLIQEIGILEQQRISRLTFERNQLNNLMQRRKCFTHNTNHTNMSQAIQRDSQTAEFTILKLQMMTEARAPLNNFEITKTFKIYFPHNNLDSVLFKYQNYYKPNRSQIKNLPQIYSQLVKYLLYPYDYIDKYKFHSMDKTKQQSPSKLKSTINNQDTYKRRLVFKNTKQFRKSQIHPSNNEGILSFKSKKKITL